MAEKRKKMTQKEIAERRSIKKELQEAGVLPPDKKKLNRRKFCAEAEALLRQHNEFGFYAYLCWAFSEMLDKHDFSAGGGLSPEAVGAAKVIHLAARRQAFEKERDGKPYKLGELIDAVGDIFEA